MTWSHDEPVRGDYPPVEFLGLAGTERMRLGVEGKMPAPPIHHLFGLRSIDAGPGFSTFSMPLSPWLQTGGGLYLGGVAGLAADAPLGGAILSTVAPGVFGVTSELSMNYLRPAMHDSRELIARARQISVGNSLGLSEALVEDARGRTLAHLTSRYFFRWLDPPPQPLEPVVVPMPDYPTPSPYLRPLDEDLSVDPKWLDASGLETFRGVIDGVIPEAPYNRLLGLRFVDASEGGVSCSIVATPWLTSPARTVYGGVIAAIADISLTAAVATTIPAGSSSAPLDVKVQFLRPGIADGSTWQVQGSVVHRGNSLAIARAEVINAEGKQLALATGSSMILEGRPWSEIAVIDEPTADE